MARNSKPQSAAQLVSSALKAYHVKADVERYSFVPNWPEIVGDQIAKIAKPERITRDGTLIVRVIDAAYAQEFTFRAEELLSKLHQFDEGRAVISIRFISGDPKAF